MKFVFVKMYGMLLESVQYFVQVGKAQTNHRIYIVYLTNLRYIQLIWDTCTWITIEFELKVYFFFVFLYVLYISSLLYNFLKFVFPCILWQKLKIILLLKKLFNFYYTLLHYYLKKINDLVIYVINRSCINWNMLLIMKFKEVKKHYL